jgi:hypothetical protein
MEIKKTIKKEGAKKAPLKKEIKPVEPKKVVDPCEGCKYTKGKRVCISCVNFKK